MKNSQCQQIAEFIEKHGHINPIEALSCIGCFRLAARIAELEKAGHQYEHVMKTGVNRDGVIVHYMEYKKVLQ